MLEVKKLNAWWGGAQALFDVSLSVARGEMVVLQGLNGAGKSTLLQAIIGIGPYITYEVCSFFDSKEIKHALQDLPAHQRARLGLGYVPEDRRLFAALSVQDNLRIAYQGPAKALAEREMRALDLFPQLKTMLSRPAAQMSGGQQQMLAIARVLMTEPQLLLLDEPCEGIAPVLVEQMRDALLALKIQGMSMLIAEQNAVLSNRADRVIQMT